SDRMRGIAYCVLFVLILIGLGMLMWHLSHLPDQVASHFNGQGEPDGYMSRMGYAVMMMLLLVGMPAFLVGITKATRFLPKELVNMPNKEYWLADDRRVETLASVETMIVWISCLTEGLFLGLQQLTYYANMNQANLSTTGMIVLLALYLIGVAVSIVWMYRRFRLPHGALRGAN
ncbi:MAG: DUF1648 domain-containing protein, partial [Planctomycetota bacterium]